MEYTLLLEKIQRKRILVFGLIVYFLFIIFSSMTLGLKGVILSLGLLFFTILAPLFYGKHKLFLFVWILIIPLIDNFRPILIGDINPFTYFVTGLTFPIAFCLIYKKTGEVTKEIPAVLALMIFELIITANFLRPDTSTFELFNVFKLHLIELFIIFTSYFYFKKNSPEQVFNWINIFTVLNACAAIFQKVTGTFLMLIEGIQRAGGLVGHPNDSAFLINIYLPLGLYMFLNAETKRKKIIWGASVAVNILALILTMTKSGYLAFGLMLCILFFYLPSKMKIRMISSIVFISIIALFLNFSLHLNIIENI